MYTLFQQISNLEVTKYTVTPDSDVVAAGNCTVYKQGRFYYFIINICFEFDSIEAWSQQKIGTIDGWDYGAVFALPACLNAMGYSPTVNMPTLGLKITEDGSVYVNVHGAVSGLKGIWFYTNTVTYR